VEPDTGAFRGWREGPDYPETVSRNAAVTYSVGGRTYILVAGGGPYSGSAGNRTPRCFYAALYSEVCFGDLDGDRDIDLSDLAILLAHYGMTSGAEYEDGDLDEDGDVDLTDLAALLAVYGTSCD
jgi:hypothetical protein